MSRGYWNGHYETSDEGKQSLEEDILNAGIGKFAYPTSDGGTIKQTEHSINAYFPDPDDPSGHSHLGVNDQGQFYQK